MIATSDLASLVTDQRIHRRVYTDPELFELEMDRIFGRSWLFVAHESQLKTPGEFIRTRLGRHEVLVTRDRAGAVHVVRNSCAHRGVQLCAIDSGRVRNFVCPYHSWAFRPDGSLATVPHQASYGPDFSLSDPKHWLIRAPRVDQYRGFYFASWAEDGIALTDHLGIMTGAIDNLIDRAPGGEIEVAGGTFRLEYRGNWKYHQENSNDTVHPTFVHESSVESARDAAGHALDNNQARDMMRSNNFSQKEWEGLGLAATSEGHSYMGGFYSSGLLSPEQGDPVSREYREALAAAKGEERAAAILEVDRFNSLIYPNVSLNAQYHQMRIVHPLAVDRTRVIVQCFRLKGAPDKIFHRAVRFLSTLNSPASMIFSDDVEIFERAQFGLSGEGRDWLDMSRGGSTEFPQPDGSLATPGASELPVRAQFRAWLNHMTAEA